MCIALQRANVRPPQGEALGRTSTSSDLLHSASNAAHVARTPTRKFSCHFNELGHSPWRNPRRLSIVHRVKERTVEIEEKNEALRELLGSKRLQLQAQEFMERFEMSWVYHDN